MRCCRQRFSKEYVVDFLACSCFVVHVIVVLDVVVVVLVVVVIEDIVAPAHLHHLSTKYHLNAITQLIATTHDMHVNCLSDA